MAPAPSPAPAPGSSLLSSQSLSYIESLYADYTANRYHKVGDQYDPNWDFRGVMQDVEAFHAVGKQLADETTFPAWKADADFSRPAAEERRR